MSATGRRYLTLAGVALAVVVTAWVMRVHEGRKSLAACDAAIARGDRVEAIVFGRSAAEARCPGCAAPELGVARLQAIAKESEGRGDDATAVAAWRAVRAATLGSVVFDSASPRRERADAEIARLEHRIDLVAAAAGGNPSPAATEERLRAALAVSTVPSTIVFVFLSIGGALFLFGALRFVRAKRLRVIELGWSAVGGGVAALGLLF